MRRGPICAVVLWGCSFNPSGNSETDPPRTPDGAVVEDGGDRDAAAVDAADTMVDRFFAQAEDFTATASLDGVHDWVVLTANPGFTGSGYVRADPDPPHSECLAVTSTCGAEVTYAFSITVGGDYQLTVRTSAEDSDSDSFWWGVDGAVLPSAVTVIPQDASWVERLSVDSAALAPGSHVLHIWFREDGVELDTVELSLVP